MFFLGALLLAAGYGVAYYGINVLAWSRDSSRQSGSVPAPLSSVLGLPGFKATAAQKGWLPIFNFEGATSSNPWQPLAGVASGNEGSQNLGPGNEPLIPSSPQYNNPPNPALPGAPGGSMNQGPNGDVPPGSVVNPHWSA